MRRSMMLHTILALAGALSPGAEAMPLLIRECDRCGIGLAGRDAEAGLTRCRECSAAPDAEAAVVARRDPIEVACPVCRRGPGEACDRRTMGRRWMYHRARVDAAEGGR